MPQSQLESHDRTPFAILVGSGLAAVAICVAIGGAAAPFAVSDPGAAVRWGLPIVQLIHDVAVAVTIGLLLVGAFIVPETGRTHRRVTLARLAGGWAAVWGVAGLAGVVLEFAALSGMSLTTPGLLTQLQSFIWQLDVTRIGLLSALGAFVIAGFAGFVVRRKEGLAWLVFGAWLALAPLALTGHSAATEDHMGGVNALAMHLLGATTWIGGLVALIVMRSSLGNHLAISVRRYSTVAIWCYGFVLGSGLLATYINLGSISALASPYGLLLGIKTVAIIALGVAGWWHRRTIIAALEKGASSAAAFTRLALGEIFIMGVALGAAVAVARTPSPGELSEPISTPVYALTGYPDPGPPSRASWLTSWQPDYLWITVSAVAIGIYLMWAVRLHRRGDAWPVLRTLSWVIGWLIFVYATSGAPGVYGKVLFSWHMIEHMGVAMIAPLFLVPGAPITLALRALPSRTDKTMGPRELILKVVHSKYLRVFANPVIAAAMFFFSMAIFYYSPLFELALRTHTGHVLMMIHFLMSGYIFVWVLIGTDPGPKKWPPLALLVVLFTTISFHAFFGVILTESNSLLAPDFFNNLGLAWMDDPLRDQHVGGAIAWGLGEVPTLVLAIAVAWQWMRSDDKETRRKDRRAERDGDADLEAYNRALAALADRDARQR
ncbi:cytochrome c oxidase assembly protein [Janibacter sp. GXQ6167]|uniref:cytochrome c oxidase assembly protein n=1 Tax=Janibacter sp. GXQ6167 TaxID=3240791 RepID=UPI003525D583